MRPTNVSKDFHAGILAKQFGHFLAQNQLAVFVVLALIFAATMTFVSLRIYATSGAVKLDLSRPGYETVRRDVTGDSTAATPYPSSGPLNAAALQDFRDRLYKEKSDLQAAGNFDAAVLDDSNLGF